MQIRKINYPRKISIGLFLITFTLSVGIIGFILIEGYTFLEAFYMTIITISTVGFEEIRPLSDGGRIFTSFLIITNIGIFAYAITTISSFIIEGEFRNFFKLSDVEEKLKKFKNHIVVCGYGRNGKEVCHELEKNKQSYLVIEKNKVVIERYLQSEDILFIEGDATDDDILLKANIQSAKALITTLPKDADNVFVALTAKEVNPKIQIISRASEESSEVKLLRAGVNNVILPEKIGGAHMASLVSHPDVVEFIQLITGQEGTGIAFEELDFGKLSDNFKDKTIKDLDIRNRTGANVIGLKDDNGKYIINPSADIPLSKNSKLILLGSEEQIKNVRKLVSDS